MTTKTNVPAVLLIRFAKPGSTPADYTVSSAVSPSLEDDHYWRLCAGSKLLGDIVRRALAADDLNDYTLVER